MSNHEKEPPLSVLYCDESDSYDRYLHQRGIVSADGARAKGILYKDGHMEVVIDRPYYLNGGILPDQLQAIVVHEQTELTSEAADPHYEATVAEYRYIFDHDGAQGLRIYHTNLCNLTGGLRDTREQALSTVLS